MARHGYAAFARADVADARRGHPATSLADYAAARGLEWLDRRSAAGYSAAFPGFEEYRYNAVRGVLPGGRHGVLFHQLLEVPVTGSPNVSGTLHASTVKVKNRRWWMPDRTDIPYIGAFLDTPTDDREPEAFESHAVWIPTTTVAINVPEAALPFFLTRIDRRHHLAPFDFPHQERLNDGWRLRAHGPTPPLDIDAILARHTDDPYFGVFALRGTIIVRRNGYLADLDELARDACAIADAFAAASAPSPALPFATELRAPHSHHPEVTPAWREGYARLAQRLQLTEEDADEYHRAFPTLGVPGRAVAVLRGELAPGVHGRLVYSAERNLRVAERARGAVLLETRDLPPTPPGGERHPDRNLVYEQRDGVAVLWSLCTAGFYREEQEELIERALAFARVRLQV
ncbi:hypothetical protein OJ997_22470 [Solirubrobacter phytolaccae]|uniref:Uncharacterized protein n=1 Tax=Solirubrobacter phytolaccae TaxID=1404360 RepID=A0A9X3NBW8_9ACTN|nr:hypothetical protein [Solirubrobacter phytolaccae]MDA0183091.1 hypothetical protein [Solirubrobacter phytolaccae]